MRAIAQDRYGDADELRLIHVPAPEVGADDVLIRVRAAGLHIGDWHVMTGQPYLMRIMGFGFRSPEGPGPGHGRRRHRRSGRAERDPLPGR